MSPTSQPVFAGTRCLPLEDYFYRMPLVPYICPPLHPELLRLVENIGRETVLEPGERIYQKGEPVSRFAVVKKGLLHAGSEITAPNRLIIRVLPVRATSQPETSTSFLTERP